MTDNFENWVPKWLMWKTDEVQVDMAMSTATAEANSQDINRTLQKNLSLIKTIHLFEDIQDVKIDLPVIDPEYYF